MLNGCFSTAIAIAASLYTSRREISRGLLKQQAREHLAQIEQKNRLAVDNLHSIERADQALAVAHHDELHHLRALAALCREQPEQAAAYAASLIHELETVPPLRFTENMIINAILTVQAGKAREQNVAFHAEALLPAELSIPDKDLCTVLMNLLENAVEAAAKTRPREARRVTAQLYIEDNCLLVVIKNSLPPDFDPAAFRATGASTKLEGGHGIGMSSAAAVLSHYDGELRYTMDGELLTLHTGMWLGGESDS